MNKVKVKMFEDQRPTYRKNISDSVERLNNLEDLNELLWISKCLETNSIEEIVKHKVESKNETFIFNCEKLIWGMINKRQHDKRKKTTKPENERIDKILKAIYVIKENIEELKEL
jgi:hypothetical protein